MILCLQFYSVSDEADDAFSQSHPVVTSSSTGPFSISKIEEGFGLDCEKIQTLLSPPQIFCNL